MCLPGRLVDNIPLQILLALLLLLLLARGYTLFERDQLLFQPMLEAHLLLIHFSLSLIIPSLLFPSHQFISLVLDFGGFAIPANGGEHVNSGKPALRSSLLLLGQDFLDATQI